MEEFIISFGDQIIMLLGLVLVTVLGWIKGKGWLNEKAVGWLKDTVGGAVTAVYYEYVKDLKAAKEDGKLTDEEKAEARSKAMAKIIEAAKAKGFKDEDSLLKTFGPDFKDKVFAMIEEKISSNKSKPKE